MTEEFKASMLIDVARSKAEKFPWLADALSQCGSGKWESSAYVRYVSGLNANQSGSEWQFERNIHFKHPTLGEIVIDILKGNRVGGIEFVDKIDSRVD